MSVKRDYTDSSLRTRYRDVVDTQTLTRVTVESNEKRTRAELLDSIENLFQGQQKRLNTESLRAILHILVKSSVNSSDDDTGGATTDQVSAINANTAKTSFPGFGTTSGKALEGNTTLLQLGTTGSTALAGDTTTITTAQANAITANTAKVSQGLNTANSSMTFDILENRGAYSIRINVVCDDGATRTFTASLR